MDYQHYQERHDWRALAPFLATAIVEDHAGAAVSRRFRRAVYAAQFEDRLDISEPTLLDVAGVKAGLLPGWVEEALPDTSRTDAARRRLADDWAAARSPFLVFGVPTLVLDEQAPVYLRLDAPIPPANGAAIPDGLPSLPGGRARRPGAEAAGARPGQLSGPGPAGDSRRGIPGAAPGSRAARRICFTRPRTSRRRKRDRRRAGVAAETPDPLPRHQVVLMKIGVARETAPGERRVALVPEALGKLTAAGIEILVEAGAGLGALIPDSAFTEAGATVVATDDLYRQADVIVRVQKPSKDEVGRLRRARRSSGLLQPLLDPKLMAALAEAGVTAISLDAIPRTLSRAQTMDALSSQANVGGYKAVLLAANAFGRYFPLLTTAAGTAKPANVLILGIGVAGLQAIGTARRLGAVVKAYDVRPETREQAESLGAGFVTLKTQIDATGAGGYARELTAEERAAQQAELNEVIGGMDVVITTAQVPGRKPPVLVTAEAVAQDEARLGHRRHGRLGPRRQLRAVEGRRDGRHRQPA